MEPTFTFRNIHATDGLREHTEAKLEKLQKYIHKGESVHVILSIEHLDHCAEITLVDTGRQLVGHAKSHDMYTSIDEAVHKVERQLHDRKERLTHHKGRPSTATLAS